MNRSSIAFLLGFLTCAAAPVLLAKTAPVPDWAWPGTATRAQVPPPRDFHRPTVTFDAPIGIFTGQSDVGGPLLPGSASFDPAKKQYTVNSASYNIWYTRDEFRYVWVKMSGDVSLAADINFPNPNGYGDRKVVLIIRQDLDDDAKEAMTALHGAGLIHLALRTAKGEDIKEAFRTHLGADVTSTPKRLGIEKRGDSFVLYASLRGEPLHPIGPPAKLHFDAPFYVGIGFCSHLPVTSDTAVVSNVVLENAAGKVK